MNTTIEPYLSSFDHFQRYEDHILSIVRNWPKLSTFPASTSNGLSATALAFHINASIAALRDQHHDSRVPFAKFIEMCDEVVIVVVDETVVCGPADMLQRSSPAISVGSTLVSQSVPRVNLVNPERDLIKAVVIMHHHRLLSEPSHITLQDDSNASYLRDMCKIYDVSLKQIPFFTYLIL